MISRDEAIALGRSYNVVPLVVSMLADRATPLELFARLEPGSSDAFLLESVSGGENVARYSFLGVDAPVTLRFRGDTWTQTDVIGNSAAGDGETRQGRGGPWSVLAERFARYRAWQPEGLPRFCGGAVGYIGYDCVRHLERLPDGNPEELDIADAALGVYDTVVAFDHARQTAHLVHNLVLADGAGDADVARGYDAGVRRLDALAARLGAPGDAPVVSPLPATVPRSATAPVAELGGTERAARQRFCASVSEAQEHIAAGDIFQVVLSRRERVPTSASPLSLYRALRVVNPSPYMFFLKSAGMHAIGASPEMLVRVAGGLAEARPIAGTRRRGANAAEDAALEQELRDDAKERAEHLMLVDLGRNDLGRVCRAGTVRVGDFMRVERYSHLMHLVSDLTGTLREGVTSLEALAACFPAGTVSGAPKVRAMEIIDELEPVRRGLYAGTVPYLDFNGNLDSCIAIRTMVLKDGVAYLQAGAGIVADSRPERELEETDEKLGALRAAIALGEQI